MMEESVGVRVSGIVQVNTSYGPMPALLLEDDAERVLVILVGGTEALSIAAAVRGIRSPVPNTHDFMMKILDEMNVKVKRGEIFGLEANRFLARITVETKEGETVVEGRPSDIIALALRAGANLYVTEDVMSEASIEKSELIRRAEKEGREKETQEEEH